MKIINKNRQEKGITLIALVITIIVLLILAGISISMLTGEHGILQRAEEAKKNTEIASAKEQIQVEVLGSYGTDGKLDMNRLKTNLEKIGAIVTGEDFPLTVTLNGFTFTVDSDGNVEKAGPTIAVDTNSITITAEDGGDVTKGEVPANKPLKINFTASVEGGSVTVSPTLPHITTAEEMAAKKVTFTITGSVSGETVGPLTYTVDLKDVYESLDVNAQKVKNNAKSYYGSKVTGYTCDGAGVETWRIFFADNDNIYLIADDYISIKYAPKGKGGTALSANSDYHLSFGRVYNDYSGSRWIVNNSKAKKWLNKYFNYTADGGTTYPNKTSTNKNIGAVAFMMDTSDGVWGKWANTNLAEYAIGGPTLEMYVESYKDSHPESNISCNVTGTDGYSYSNASGLEPRGENNEIYIKPSFTNAYGMWLASPSSTYSEDIIYADKTRLLDVQPLKLQPSGASSTSVSEVWCPIRKSSRWRI